MTTTYDTSVTLGAFGVSQSVRQLDRNLRQYVADGTLTLPEDVTKARQHAIAVAAEATRVAAEGQTGVRDLAHAIAAGTLKNWTKPETFTVAAVREIRLQALRTAAESSAYIFASTARDFADDILAEIENKIVTPVVEIFAAAAEVTTDADTPEALLRAGRTEDAAALARALDPAHLDTLRRADALRFVLLGYERGDDALPWFSGATLARLDGPTILAHFRKGRRFLDFSDPTTAAEAGLIPDDDGDDDDVPTLGNVIPHASGGGVSYSLNRDSGGGYFAPPSSPRPSGTEV
ncbi:hypothetical protein FE374_05110 [Georgenia yuyongxinii]|uniref:Uncharacterized protein n=1 Tax=Georgenia yuyongxinii TaxID=2589797 RepID=A0A5B8C3K0_9MICO|nr:hypothetical protein [Georgenia yuyongxinii]QDC24091.1 hypothetical protein FE374_05110 [Georgenia yuyongxinii]